MRKKLNDIVIRSCKPRARTYVLGDAALPRFANPHHPEGGQDVRLRLSRPSHRQGQCFTIGRYPDVPLARARELANDARKAVAKGDTPIKVEHAAAQKKIQPTPTWSRSMTKPTL
jgi:hypothetical protein